MSISVRYFTTDGLLVKYAVYRDDSIIGIVDVHVAKDITAATVAAGKSADDIALEMAKVKFDPTSAAEASPPSQSTVHP